MPNPRSSAVELKRHLAAAPQAVFDAFSSADMLVRWLSPAPEIGLTILAFDFREGGNYRFAYHLPDRKTLIVGGVYRAIEPGSRIRFSWIWEEPDEHAGIESEVQISMTAQGDGTALLVRHECLARDDAFERHQAGWTGALARLAAVLDVEFGHGVRF